VLGYYGNIDWQNNDPGASQNEQDSDPFQPGGMYIANISLIPFPGYAFDPDLYEVFSEINHHILRPAGTNLENFYITYTGTLSIRLEFPKLPAAP
jgi:hypothetical protein